MNDSEKIAKIREYVEKNYDPDFDYAIEHWDNGNYDDSYQYGHDSGFNFTLETIKSIIDDE